MGSSYSQVRTNRMKFSLFCSVILVVVCIVDSFTISRVYRPPPLQLNCRVGCEIYYRGPKEDLGKCIKECEAANNRTGEEVEEEAQNIDYDCNLFPDFSSIPTKHWHAFILKCSVEESKKKEPNK